MSKKRILVTGAGSGFGEGSAEGAALGLAQNGHEVIAGVQIWPQVSRCTKLGDLESMDRFVALNWETQQTNCT